MTNGNLIHFGGYSISDSICNYKTLAPLEVDFAIIVIGWESRALLALKHKLLRGNSCFLVRFEGDGISDLNVSKYRHLAAACFRTVEVVQMCSPMKADEIMTAAERLVTRVQDLKAAIGAVDYSSMPRVVTQTLFRQFMVVGVCPKVHWLYWSGQYDGTALVKGECEQDAQSFFTLRGAAGNGGMSFQRVAILALGADRSLIRSFLRQGAYDVYHFLDATSPHSPILSSRIGDQRNWLVSEYNISRGAFVDCDARSIVGTIRSLISIVGDYTEGPGTAIDIFCSGPKSHAVAASALVSSFRNIRLVARTPKRYIRLDVKGSSEVTVTSVTDFTNPRVVSALLQR
jgi:hypothetical protein